MFQSTEDLIQHLKKDHSVLCWVCHQCLNAAAPCDNDVLIFDSADDWSKHCKDVHTQLVSSAQQKMLMDLSERLLVKPTTCPICSCEVPRSLKILDEHIAEHLHEFALSALPWDCNAYDCQSSDAQNSQVPASTSGLRGLSEAEGEDEISDRPGDDNAHEAAKLSMNSLLRAADVQQPVAAAETWALSAATNLGDSYRSQGKMMEAVEMYVHARMGYERVLGATHPATLSSTATLGKLYQTQGKLEAAMEMYQRVLDSYDHIGVPDDLVGFTTFADLASVYGTQGQLENAMRGYKRAAEGFEEIYGSDHPFTRSAAANLEKTTTQLYESDYVSSKARQQALDAQYELEKDKMRGKKINRDRDDFGVLKSQRREFDAQYEREKEQRYERSISEGK